MKKHRRKYGDLIDDSKKEQKLVINANKDFIRSKSQALVPMAKQSVCRDLLEQDPEKFKEFNGFPGPQNYYQKLDDWTKLKNNYRRQMK